ncbi:MAG: hypothetical protein JKY37_18875 [Nannocystaceae bacterium]|nr:hypothetical protein [Nannocystaceae bacterium]
MKLSCPYSSPGPIGGEYGDAFDLRPLVVRANHWLVREYAHSNDVWVGGEYERRGALGILRVAAKPTL